MRISDWSSDVCSSDLLDVRAESYAEKPRSRKRRRAGFWARARRRRFPVFPTMMRNLAIRAQEGERSEEHTSELQSLMRISYAVFCLKKKKTDKTTTRKHRSHQRN